MLGAVSTSKRIRLNKMSLLEVTHSGNINNLISDFMY